MPHISFALSLALITIELLLATAQAQPTLFPRSSSVQRFTVVWQEQELATALEKMAQATQATLWLDRRVDRQQPVTIQLNDVSLFEALENLAHQQALGFSQIGSVIYIGPQQTADHLPTLIEQAHESLEKLPTKVKRRWKQTERVRWPHLSEPRTLAQKWARQTSTKLIDSEQIPHDLWRENSLPPMPKVEQLVLLLAGFDLTCKFSSDANTCSVVPIDYPAEKVAKKSPRRTRPKTAKKGPSRKLFSLTLENQQVGSVLDQFSQQLNLEIVWPGDTTATKSLRQRRISCDVKNVALNELLQSVLAPAELTFRQADRKIIIQQTPAQ